MKKIVKAFSGLILVAALFVAGSALVITYPDEYTIVRQFGEIVRVVNTPGVSVKIPLMQTSSTIPRALQIYDIPKSDVITKDKKSAAGADSDIAECSRKCFRWCLQQRKNGWSREK